MGASPPLLRVCLPHNLVNFCVYAIMVLMTESTEQFAVATGILPGANEDYTAKDLEHLSDQEHVRKRPAMYIGDTTSRGLHHLVSEVVDNSIDEAMAGFASTIVVQINNDGSVTVEDDGEVFPSKSILT